MATQSRNSRLKSHLAVLEANAHSATSQADIETIASLIKTYLRQGQYKFNQTLPIIGLILAGLAGLLSFWQQMDISHDQRTFLIVFALVTAFVSLLVILLRYHKVKSVSALVYVRAVAINANIKRDYNYNGHAYWKELRSTFNLFSCGDESQSITKRYFGNAGEIPFTLFEFKYVDVSRHTTTNSKGHTSTRTSRTTRFKYGMIVKFKDFNYLTINVKRFSCRWDSASRRFNKLFKITCINEIAAAKFFDPKTVLSFTDEFSFVKSLDTTPQSFVCIELPKAVFPTNLKAPNLRKPHRFLQAIENPASIPMLEKSKELVQVINQQK